MSNLEKQKMEREITNFEKEQVKVFKAYWYEYYCHIDLNLTDREILMFINEGETGLMDRICSRAADYLLANGLADVQE